MATLTWQDVAGRVAAPDFSDASAMITQGIQGLGKSVADLGAAPEKRRQAEVAQKNQLLALQMGFTEDSVNKAMALDKSIEQRKEKAAIKGFGAAQSVLEAGFQDAGYQGKTFDEYLKGSKVYNDLPEDVKAYGASHFSDAYYRGQQAREQHLAREQNDRMQEAQLALQRQSLAESRAARVEAARSRKITDEAAQMRLDELKRTEADRKFLNTPLGILTARVGTNYNDAIGKKYENMDWGEIAKASGIKGYSEYRENLNALNAKRLEQGKRALPEGAAKSLLAAQIGQNAGIPSVFNEVDGFDVDNQLLLIADQYDASLRETDVLNRFKAMQDKGIPFKDSDVLAELARANPPVTKRKPVDPPITMFNWKGAGK